MNIVVFYQYFGTPNGSWSTRVYELTRRWVKAGHAVTVVTAPYEKSDIRSDRYISLQEIDGVHLIVINTADSNRASLWKRGWHALRFAFASCRIALREPCDVVIASSGPITVGIPALAAKWFRRKKMVFEIRDLWPQGAVELEKIRNAFMIRIAWWFEKICYKNADLVVACSPGMEESVRNRFPSVHTMVVSNAADVALFGAENMEKTDHEPFFVYAGSLGLMDHGDLLIDAMKLVRNPRIRLKIIGDGAERSTLEQSAKGMGNVEFLGLLPKTEVARHICNAVASLVVFRNKPVLQTSSPNKLFDAFAAGVPVIHNTTGWMKILTSETGCGMSVDPDDAKELADVMDLLSGDSALRDEMAKQSKALGLGRYNRDRLADEYLAALVRLGEPAT